MENRSPQLTHSGNLSDSQGEGCFIKCRYLSSPCARPTEPESPGHDGSRFVFKSQGLMTMDSECWKWWHRRGSETSSSANLSSEVNNCADWQNPPCPHLHVSYQWASSTGTYSSKILWGLKQGMKGTCPFCGVKIIITLKWKHSINILLKAKALSSEMVNGSVFRGQTHEPTRLSLFPFSNGLSRQASALPSPGLRPSDCLATEAQRRRMLYKASFPLSHRLHLWAFSPHPVCWLLLGPWPEQASVDHRTKSG